MSIRTKMPLKFCANLTFQFQEAKSILDRYRLAKEAGFKGVESAFPTDINLDELVEVQQETGLEQVLLNIDTGSVTNGSFGCASFLNSLDDFNKNLNNTIKYAKALNCEKIHLMAGKHSEPTDNRHENFYISNLRYAAGKLAQNGMVGVIEPINKYAVPGYYLNSFDHAVKVLEKVNHSNLKLMVDLYHLQHITGNVTRSLEDFSKHIGHVQVRINKSLWF